MSYGFPIINFCNPGAHYETPFIKMQHLAPRIKKEYSYSSTNLWAFMAVIGRDLPTSLTPLKRVVLYPIIFQNVTKSEEFPTQPSIVSL
jgi:hypothetical protein